LPNIRGGLLKIALVQVGGDQRLETSFVSLYKLKLCIQKQEQRKKKAINT
jgi:hypothetical protein